VDCLAKHPISPDPLGRILCKPPQDPSTKRGLRRLLFLRTLATAATCLGECCRPAVCFVIHMWILLDGPWKNQEQRTSDKTTKQLVLLLGSPPPRRPGGRNPSPRRHLLLLRPPPPLPSPSPEAPADQARDAGEGDGRDLLSELLIWWFGGGLPGGELGSAIGCCSGLPFSPSPPSRPHRRGLWGRWLECPCRVHGWAHGIWAAAFGGAASFRRRATSAGCCRPLMSTHFYSCRHLLGLQVQRFVEQQ
jgi:hypothetical protein